MFCELKNFSFQKNGQKILNNIFVKIPYQKTTIILGKNGSGKTTLLKAINQLIQPTSGERIAKNLSSKPMLFQKSVSFDKTAKYNQEIFFKTLKIKNPDLKWADEFCTRNFFYKKMGDLSAGEQQKIFLARYFSVNPEPLMMDEPNQNLDNESEKSFQKLILEEKNKNKFR